TAFVFTYGVTDQFDLGLAVPLVNVDLKAVSTATIQRLGTGVCCAATHQFVGGGQSSTIQSVGSASGLGDVLARAKLRILRGPVGALAVFADVRVPTGEERDLLGTGTTQVKGALIGSLHFNPVSMHVNGGYTWAAQKNGVKVVPDEINYSLGIDVAAHPRLTFTAEVIGRDVRNTNAVVIDNHTFTANQLQTDLVTTKVITAVFPRLVVNPIANQNRVNASVGLKVNPVGNLLLTLNGLFSLDNKGLQDKFTPLIGLDYSF
ncbi:MAG TPA: transporter, partial [Thermoanaerobaculia bacterium]|nr:transporter [Thermoanaerobaculia bacterium]